MENRDREGRNQVGRDRLLDGGARLLRLRGMFDKELRQQMIERSDIDFLPMVPSHTSVVRS